MGTQTVPNIDISSRAKGIFTIRRVLKILGKFLIGLFFLGGISFIGYKYWEYKAYQVEVSNLNSRSVTISWITEDPEPGMVLYREGKFFLPVMLTNTFNDYSVDDRDYSFAEVTASISNKEEITDSGMKRVQSATDIISEIRTEDLGKYWTHHVTLRNLKPETEYEFMVGDGFIFKKVMPIEIDSTKITTRKEIDNFGTPEPTYGIIRYYNEEDDQILRLSDAIVYATVSENFSGIKSEKISSILNVEGGWYLDIDNARTNLGEKFLDSISENEATSIKIELIIESAWLGRWSTELDFLNSSPAQTIDIGDGELNEDIKLEKISLNDENGESLSSTFVGSVFASESLEEERARIAREKAVASSIAAYAYKTKIYFEGRDPLHPLREKDKGRAAEVIKQMDEEIGYARDVSNSTNMNQINNVKENFKNSRNNNPSAKVVEETPEDDPRGQCYRDECLAGKRCGFVNAAPCSCKCSENDPPNNVKVAPGGKCTCNNGVPIADNSKKKDPINESNVPSKETVCFNNNGGAQGSCYSYTNNCWYGVGHTTQRGEKCSENEYNGKKIGQWGSPIFSEKGGTPPPEKDVDINLSCRETGSSLSRGHLINVTKDKKVYKCVGYNWVEVKDGNEALYLGQFVPTPGGHCQRQWDTTYINGERYDCNGRSGFATWVKVSSDFPVQELINITTDQEVNEDCPTEFCLCKKVVEVSRSDPRYPSTTTTVSIEKDIIIEYGKSCEGQGAKSWSSSDNLFYSKVHASDNSKYILDTENGTISGLKAGVYLLEKGGITYAVNIIEDDLKNNNGNLVLYIDSNGDGVLGEGDVRITDEATLLTIKPLIEGFEYNFKEGINFVSFPFIFEEPEVLTGSSLLNYLNEKYNNSFYSISKFQAGKWLVVGDNSGDYNQNDFQIIPGEGYILKSRLDQSIILYGKEIQYESSNDRISVGLYPGWNLIGMYGNRVKTYTARTLLEGITNYDKIDFTATNVSRWEESKSLYEGIQGEKNDQNMMEFYGLDFPISKQRAYFVKITEGSGNWEPELKEN